MRLLRTLWRYLTRGRGTWACCDGRHEPNLPIIAGGHWFCRNCGDHDFGPIVCGCSHPMHGSTFCANCGGYVSSEVVGA